MSFIPKYTIQVSTAQEQIPKDLVFRSKQIKKNKKRTHMTIEVKSVKLQKQERNCKTNMFKAQHMVMLQENEHLLPISKSNQYCDNRQQYIYREKRTESKTKIMFTNLLSFHMSSPQKNYFSLLNPTSRFKHYSYFNTRVCS